MKNLSIITLVALLLLSFSPNTIAQSDEVQLDLKQVRVIGNQLHFDFLFTNKANDMEYILSLSDIKLYDGEGEIFNPESVTFGQVNKTYGAVIQKCVKDIPIKMKIVFNGQPSKLANVNSLIFPIKYKNKTRKFPFKFTGISVPATNNPEVVKAHEDPLYFEVEPDVFAKMTSVKREGKIVRITFMVENKGSDKKVGFSLKNTRIIDDKGNTIEVKAIDFSGMHKTYGEAFKEMPQGIPMKLEYHFELTDPAAKKIMMFEFAKHNNVFQIRGIEI